MRVCGARLLLVVAVLSAACGEAPRSFFALGDVAVVLAMSALVVDDGPHAEGLLPPPPERRRAEILPGDEVEVSALVASSDGEVDLDERDALWFLASSACEYQLGATLDTGDCSDSEDAPYPCRIGRGASPRFIMPRRFVLEYDTFDIYEPSYCVVVGLERSTDECVERAGREYEGLRPGDCAIGTRDANTGPLLRWLDLVEELPAQIDPEDIPPPHALDILTPDAGPGLGPVSFAIVSPATAAEEPRVVPEGGTFTAPPSAKIRVEHTTDLRDEQVYLRVWGADLQGAVEAVDTRGWYVGHREAAAAGTSERHLYTPDHATSFPVWIVVEDSRGSLAWGRWTLEVVE